MVESSGVLLIKDTGDMEIHHSIDGKLDITEVHGLLGGPIQQISRRKKKKGKSLLPFHAWGLSKSQLINPHDREAVNVVAQLLLEQLNFSVDKFLIGPVVLTSDGDKQLPIVLCSKLKEVASILLANRGSY